MAMKIRSDADAAKKTVAIGKRVTTRAFIGLLVTGGALL